MPSQLTPTAVHLWTLPTGGELSADDIARYRDLLSPTELAKCDRFVFERHRQLYLVSHALVRLVLSEYAEISPEAWRFIENGHGKPEIDARLSAPPLRFNLTHTTGLAACAVCLEAAIGVDAEYVARRTDLEIARRFFSSREADYLESVSPDRQREVFFDFWTLKEAYIKARGMGLALPLSEFTMSLDATGAPTIAFSEQLDDDPNRWRFWQFQPDHEHRVALCVEQLRAGSRQVVQRQAAELGF